MIPSWWEFVLLALGAFRLTRLGGWDEWPPVERARAKLLGEEWLLGDQPTLPGKVPESQVDELRIAYRRPTLAHLFHCPFCLGWWVSLAAYGAWAVFPHATLVVLAPFAISGVVGLVAKNLDP